VNNNTFISGAPVARNVVRERDVIQRVSAAPVARGPIPVKPERASLHVGTSGVAAPRPPAPVLSRSVVSRRPAPPETRPFQERHENGRPTPAAPGPRAAKALEAKPVQPVRPALAPEVRPVRPEKPVEAHAAVPTPPPQQKVRPAQAERMQLEPRGQQPQRRTVEPLKTEAPPKKKEVAKEAPKKHEEKKEK